MLPMEDEYIFYLSCHHQIQPYIILVLGYGLVRLSSLKDTKRNTQTSFWEVTLIEGDL